ncbi:alpha/beta-hydrolase [Mycena crocata]|nr:alpha/beta-hydrolase [Mycena crocata]
MLLLLTLILLGPLAFGVDPLVPPLAFPSTNLPLGSLKTRRTTVYKPRSLDAFHRARWRSLKFAQSEPVYWDPQDGVLVPDVQDLHTLAQLARMSGNAYALPSQSNWYEVDPAWNTSFPFGWQDSDNGFRGHVFLSSDNSTVVLSIKGTTLQGPTSKQDKYNDNLLFSCCCARVDFSWVFRQVCDCYRNSWRCENSCLTKALIEDSLFYSVGVKLVNDLFFLYPTANVWLVGHTGGALAALLGTTFGLPAVAFESPGERLAAKRLHLPLPPFHGPPSPFLPAVTHVYHNGDPIPQGACTGIASVCAQGGYALETRCHLGKSIVFDTVNKLGWKVDVRKHVIKDVITKVLEAEGIEWGEGRDVPLAEEEADCVDCFKWNFGEF